jgi:hypothetical protein
MKRFFIILTLIAVLFGTHVFAQTALPEPVFAGNTAKTVADFRPGAAAPQFNRELSFLWGYSSSAANEGYMEYTPILTLAAAGTTDAEIPMSIRNNKFFIESVRLTNLAQQSYDEGDYDASSEYSAEAVRYAQLSDEYVSLQLKIRETDNAIAAARRRMDFAVSVNAAARFPAEYGRAQTAYNEARTFRAAENWDEAIAAANRVLVALTYVDREAERVPEPVPVVVEGPPPLPAQYTVRPWAVSKDCFWNIAGRPWVFNDPKKWRLLYDANKAGLPQPNNPDLMHPGMVLNIPSINGETRQGMWDASKTYSPLP